MKYCLPDNYVVRADHVLYNDTSNELVYQPEIYQLAEYLGKRADLKWIIDIGCGSGRKLSKFAHHFSIIGFDSQFGVNTAGAVIPNAQLIVHDFETELPNLPSEVLSSALVICSDVIEHLQNPDVLMAKLAELSHKVPYVIISTPDRDRARGWLDNGPPANPSHVIEWNGTEFVRYMRNMGFESIPFYGHTINTDLQRAKTTLVAIAGTHANIRKDAPRKKVAAIIHGYNEADILPEVVDYLVAHGVEVHYFDNWSTDGTWELVQALVAEQKIVHCERFPCKPNKEYEWRAQLEKTEEYAECLDADWIMHHDADEIRVAPWEGVTLTEAIAHIDALGFNAIDFTVIDFRFLEGNTDRGMPYQKNLTHFEFGRRSGHFSQVKCWKNTAKISLASSGGHDATYEGRKVFPIKFLLKHYPLRNKTQANNKVYKHRLPRFNKENESYGWHIQYELYRELKEVKGWKYYELSPWHSVHFMTEYVIERISGIGLV